MTLDKRGLQGRIQWPQITLAFLRETEEDLRLLRLLFRELARDEENTMNLLARKTRSATQGANADGLGVLSKGEPEIVHELRNALPPLAT